MPIQIPQLSRRQLLQTSALGFGSIAHSWLQAEENRPTRRHDLTPQAAQSHAPAKAMIMMMQNGGPGQMDLFDPKPDLTKFSGRVHTEKNRNVSAWQRR